MNSRELSVIEERALIQTLKNFFPETFPEEKKLGPQPSVDIHWDNAAPLLALLTQDRNSAQKLKLNFNLLSHASNTFKNLNLICDRFAKKGILQEEKIANPYWYRLPLIMGEYPRHTRVINKAIGAFNQLIENYHKDHTPIDSNQLHVCFLKIVEEISRHGPYCFEDSLTDLINMMHGFSCINMNFEEKKEEKPLECKEKSKTEILKPAFKIAAALKKNIVGSSNPFAEQSIYHINRAGRLNDKGIKIVVNAFGLKFGGHFDGLLTHTPTLIPVEDFYAVLWRELSLRMELPAEKTLDGHKLKDVLLRSLQDLGMLVTSNFSEKETKDYYISPFSTQPQAFSTPNVIKKILTASAESEQYKMTGEELLTLSDYLKQMLFRMQCNTSEPLGIGAGDPVINSEEGRDYIFQFNPSEEEWATRFVQISLHRQGPAEPLMNAARGIQHELAAAFLTETKRMGELQRSEYEETVYNAIIDNLVADLFPHPDFFENTDYPKFKKKHILSKNDHKQTQFVSYTEESPVGIFFKENKQTTPKFRRPGTIDVHSLPRDHGGISEAFQGTNSRNPLAARQFQYAEALHGGTRGDYIYNPVGPDGFIADIFNGQVVKNSDGTFLPFIGVIPKNFDREFKQKTELCASFVIRMLHSSRLAAYCPTFQLNYQKLKALFLPQSESIPELPKIFKKNSYLQNEMSKLKECLAKKNEGRNFEENEKILNSLFKNIIYLLAEIDTDDETFSIFLHHLIKDPNFLRTPSRQDFEKIIRILKINAPIQNPESTKEFIEQIDYLEKLIQAFYPKPSKENAKIIQQLAEQYKKPLTHHSDLQDYFSKLRENPKVNLSRDQSPGMLFTKLRGDNSNEIRTLRRKKADFDRMHQKNFIAGYRDPEGSIVVAPSSKENMLDSAVKSVAKFSVAMHNDDNPLAQIISAPFIGAYDGAKSQLDNKDSAFAKVCTVPLGFAGGLISGVNESGFKTISYGLKFVARPGLRTKDAITYCTSKLDTNTTSGKLALAGLFLPAIFGFVGGIIESTAKLVYDCTISPIHDFVTLINEKLNKTPEYLPNDHALHIRATPENEPGFKIQMSDKTRDTLIVYSSKESLIKKLRTIAIEILSTVTPTLSLEEKEMAAVELINNTVLTDQEWDEFHEEFKEYDQLGKCLADKKEVINNLLITACYRIFLERSDDKMRLKLIDSISSLYKLFPEQKALIKELVIYYNKHPESQEQLINLFAEDGDIRKKLSKIDIHSQTIHDAVMKIFNVDHIKHALYQGYIHHFKESKPVKITPDTVNKLPSSIKQQLNHKELSVMKDKILLDIKNASSTISELNIEITKYAEDNLEIQNDIAILNDEIEKCKKQLEDIEFFLTLLAATPSETKLDLTPFEELEENSILLSAKDKAQAKWKKYAISDLTHQFLSVKDINQLFDIFNNFPLFEKSSLIQFKMNHLKQCSKVLLERCDFDNIDAFFDAYRQILFVTQHLPQTKQFPELMKLLKDFVNKMMNAAVNKTLDIIDGNQSDNPLNHSRFIGEWLAKVAESQTDFRSLLSQQFSEPYLHSTLLKQAYLIHALETHLSIKKEDQRIHKTGLQKLLRQHYLHPQVITKNGSPHYETRHFNDVLTYLKEHGIDASPTCEYANRRAKEKIGLFFKTKLIEQPKEKEEKGYYHGR